jgi:hypothetical protein
MLKLKLKRTVRGGRKAIVIESIEVDGKKTKKELINTPDGDMRLEEGDGFYERDFLKMYGSLIESVVDWSGNDEITVDKLP